MSFNPTHTRVLAYDPNPLLADSISRGLAERGLFTSEACSRNLIETLRTFRPGIIVLDPAHLAVGPDVWRAEISRQLPSCEIIAYVAEDDHAIAQQCLIAGFVGVVSQSRDLDALVEAVTVVRQGGIYLDQGFSPSARSVREAAEEGGPREACPLSERERYVLEHVARGFSNKEIAMRLGLSAKTVETYRARAAGKLGLRRKSDIVQFALRQSWLAPALPV